MDTVLTVDSAHCQVILNIVIRRFLKQQRKYTLNEYYFIQNVFKRN